MAQVKKIAWDAIPLEKRVKIGHNRTIYKPTADLLYCSLHDHTIAFFRKSADGSFDVTLDHCGWMTRTALAAMKDFGKFVGVSFGVSRAKGYFTACYQAGRNQWLDADTEANNQRIYFNAPYIDPWSHCVIIGACFPLIAAIKAKSEYTANMAANHLRAMFPHLRDCVSVVQADDMGSGAYVPAFNAIRDCCAAYCNTGNGAKSRPINGTVALWEGSSPCGKAS